MVGVFSAAMLAAAASDAPFTGVSTWTLGAGVISSKFGAAGAALARGGGGGTERPTGGGGTARAQAHLRDGLGYTNGLVLPQPEVLVPFATSRFDEAGNLHDEDTQDAIRELLAALLDWVRQLRDGLGRAA